MVALIGSATITKAHDWAGQLDTVRAGHFEVMRLPIGKGWGNAPHMVDDLVNAGVKSIALQVPNCDISWDIVKRDLVDAGFIDRAKQHPDTFFYIEMGNEPDLCDDVPTPQQYGTDALNSFKQLVPLVTGSMNITFCLGLAVHNEFTRELLQNKELLNYVDTLAYHIYGHEQLWDAGNNIWDFWDKGELDAYGKKIILTEIGINGNIGSCRKAARYHDFAEYVKKNKPNTHAVCFWTTDETTTWPQYYINKEMAEVISKGL